MQMIGQEPLTAEEREAVERRFLPVTGCTRMFELGAFVVILPMFLALIGTTLFQRWIGDNPGCIAGAALFVVLAAASFFIVRRNTPRLSLREIGNASLYRLDVARASVIDEDQELYLLETQQGERVLLRAWMCEDIFPQRIVTMKSIPSLNVIVSLHAEGGELEVEEGKFEHDLRGDYEIVG